MALVSFGGVYVLYVYDVSYTHLSLCDYCGINPYDSSVNINERPAAIATVNCSIGLDVYTGL